jgi:hypothetical protein
MFDREKFEVQPEWVHVGHPEAAAFREVYGFAGNQGIVNLEGVRYLPKGQPSRTLLVYMHPASTLQLLPVPRAMAEHGVHVLCAGSRYARNDTALILEKVVLDLGVYLRHAKEVWGYDRIVINGWSGGGSLSIFYQSQAERPTLTETPAGDPVDIKGARLVPADAMILQAAHMSRATMLSEWIDPSVRNEDDPDDRDVELDIYSPRNPNQPPYTQEFLTRFRAAQLERVKKRTAWVKDKLARLRRQEGKEIERGFVTHRTMAEPRFLDATIDPNDRQIGTCYLGEPKTVNNGPVGLARFSTLRAWLSQWSMEDSNAHGERCAAGITVPLLAIENTADDCIPQPHTERLYSAATSRDKTLKSIKGATHYYSGQPAKLQEAVNLVLDWMAERNLL